MSSPSSPEGALKKLPVGKAVLSALDGLRTVLPPLKRRAQATALVLALRAGGAQTLRADTADVSYVLRRLCTGAAASAGGARMGMTLALSALTRSLLDDALNIGESTTDAFSAVVDAVAGVYGSEGSFAADYSGADRERALGTVAACAAIVASLAGFASASDPKPPLKKQKTVPSNGLAQESGSRIGGSVSRLDLISGPTARSIALMLRACAFANEGKWSLGCSAVEVLRTLLPFVKQSIFDKFLANVLLKWSKTHANMPDGAALSLVLHVDFGFLNSETLKDIYPSRAALHTALVSCFEQGFPLWNSHNSATDGEDNVKSEAATAECADLVPLQWSLALKLATQTNADTPHWGDVQEFWNECVCSLLIRGSESKDKKTLALAMLPVAVVGCPDVVSFSAVLNDDVGSLLASLKGRRQSSRGKATSSSGVSVRRRKEDTESYDRLVSVSTGVGQAVLDCIRQKQRSGLKHAGAWVERFIDWTIRCRISGDLLRQDVLKFALSMMSAAEIDNLFRVVVKALAEPKCSPRDVAPLRMEAVQFLFNMACAREELGLDIAKLFALYCSFSSNGMFSGDKSSVAEKHVRERNLKRHRVAENDGQLTIKAMHRHLPKKSELSVDFEPSFAGLAPIPVPEILAPTAHGIFRRLMDLVLKGKCSLLSDVFGFVLHLSSMQASLAIKHRTYSDILVAPIESVQTLLVNIEKPPVSHPVLRALRTLAQFMFLLMHDSSGRAPGNDEQSIPLSVYVKTTTLMAKCVDAVRREIEDPGNAELLASSFAKPMDSTAEGKDGIDGASENEDDRPPTALEQTTYIIAILCQQHSSMLRSVASIAFDTIGELANESVSAVIFDLMDSPEVAGGPGDAEPDDGDHGDSGSDSVVSDEEVGMSVEADFAPIAEEACDDKPLDVSKHIELDHEARSTTKEKSSGRDSIDKNSDQEDDGSSEADGDTMDMLVDDEDPGMLEVYDKHLSNHMQLLKVDKARSRRARLRSTRISSSVARLLDLVELLARRFRLRLELTDDTMINPGATYSFLDLIVRLMEFLYENDDSAGLSHISRVVSIFQKHLDRPLSLFAGNVTDDEQNDLCERFFNAIEEPDRYRRAGSAEMRMVAHAASILTFVARGNTELLAISSTGYERAWLQFSAPSNKFWGIIMFSCAISRVPDLANQLIELTLATALNSGTTCGSRVLALQALHAYTPAVRDLKRHLRDVYFLYWNGVQQILAKTCSANDAPKMWKHGAGVEDILRLVDSGLSGGDIVSTEVLEKNVKCLVTAIKHKIPRKLEKKLRKLETSILKKGTVGQ
jgi:hypothetical protein